MFTDREYGYGTFVCKIHISLTMTNKRPTHLEILMGSPSGLVTFVKQPNDRENMYFQDRNKTEKYKNRLISK